ncbi:MAG: 50S ribosomal protein L9 [Parcubacteria group bacterium GW2011_GWC2_38_7]|nr:MAG: 50S ribosomal protein L9 [Parcubacteria group bacterium GW2011_GWC2_38_7]
MKVVFTQNVAQVGNRGEVKDVKDGFALNYLFPKNLAVKATPSSIKLNSAPAKVAEKSKSKKLSEPSNIANKLRSLVLVFTEKADEKGTFFAGVTRDKIADELKKYQISIKSKNIQLSEPIKHAGDYKVAVEVAANIVSEVQVKTKNLS